MIAFWPEVWPAATETSLIREVMTKHSSDKAGFFATRLSFNLPLPAPEGIPSSIVNHVNFTGMSWNICKILIKIDTVVLWKKRVVFTVSLSYS